MAEASVIAFFSVAVFLGTIAFSATGFALAIIFLFLYQLGSLAWLDCCNIRYAVFIQTVAFVVILPVILWRANVQQNIRYDLLVGFLPITFAATPLGQYLQDYTPVGALKIVIGVLTILVALWQIREYFRNRQNECDKTANAHDNKAIDIESEFSNERSFVFFLIGSQRSGSNWLHTMITESNTVATPHPPHILKHFIPILYKFADLNKTENLQNLVKLVCEFVEKNPVPWMDKDDNKIVFDREVIFNRCQGSELPLFAIFEAVMDVFAKKNGCETWICKSMAYGKFHEDLSRHFGNRLRYVFLHRDPRDVCLSFKKALQVAGSHYYVIAEKWRHLQKIAINLSGILPKGNVHRLSYESLLANKKQILDELFQFMNADVDSLIVSSHVSKEAQLRAGKSSLWKNLVRGESIRKEQIKKWEQAGGLGKDDIKIIETLCQDVMKQLGYQLQYPEELAQFNEEEIAEFRRLNEKGNEDKLKTLHEEDPEDLERRKVQDLVLNNIPEPAISVSKSQSYLAEIESQLCPLRPVFFFILLAGFASGFLGGLIAVRGPPLIILFFFFEYPKKQIKANGAIVATINVLIRLITYIAKSPPVSYPTKAWFNEDDKYLYVSVAISGLVATPIGFWLSKHINQSLFKMVLACLLVINGITMIVTGSMSF